MENEPWYKKCIRCKNRMFGICMADVTIKQFAENGSICPLWEGKTMEIKPCPFCGNSNGLRVSGSTFYYVVCDNCDTFGPTMGTKEKAIELWNAAPRKEDVEMEKNCANCTYNLGGYCSSVPPYKSFRVNDDLCCTDWEAKGPEPAPLNTEDSSGLKTLCEKAISKWGEAAQINKAIEELLELAITLTRYQNLNLRDEDYQEKAYKILDNIHEEREDVEIMLRQLDVIFGRSEEWQRKKYAYLQLIVGDTEEVKRS